MEQGHGMMFTLFFSQTSIHGCMTVRETENLLAKYGVSSIVIVKLMISTSFVETQTNSSQTSCYLSLHTTLFPIL